MVSGITATEERIKERRSAGRSVTVLEKQLAHCKKMDRSSREFAARFHKITSQQLDAIITEGDARGWPRR